MIDLARQDLIDRLLALDEEAYLTFRDAERLHVVIVGGSALVLMEYISRSTHDIDALDVSVRLQGMLAQYDINCRVQTYINNFPYNYEDRLRPLGLPTKLIDYYTASLEDIVVAKLYSARDKDILDITTPEVLEHIDWQLLQHLATDEGEARASSLNDRRYSDFLANYTEYVKEYGPCKS
ncbi:MAG: DUF6036 family nucleotidyltransferase [Oscillospiraceae bacterium]|nr:DUF6036 family nucleotidyltransferase [Oscillospiraceae bacterium]